MLIRKGQEEISVMEAVDNLSHMAEIDLTAPIKGLNVQELTEEQISEQMQTLSWHDPEYFVYNRERVKDTLTAVFKYLKSLHEKDKGQLRDIDTQKAIQAIILLVNEAAEKLDKYTEMFKGPQKAGSVKELKEFKDLMHFYQTKVFQRYQTIPETEEKWKDEWGTETEEELLDIKRKGLKDLETVRRDNEYELFFITKEDGRPFFHRNLLRHIRLVGQFDELMIDSTEEDPFLRIKVMQDRDLHHAAQHILHVASPYVDDFCKEALKHRDMEFAACISKSLMALMLASNPRNLMQNSAGKSAISYYADFHFYLRQALASKEYNRFVSFPPSHSERFFNALINLTHVLCTSFFLRVGSRRDMVGFIHHLIERGGKGSIVRSQTSSPLSVWNQLLDSDQEIRHLLKQFPNGPLMKTVDAFREEVEIAGFDPVAQENISCQLFTIVNDDMHISCVRIPSPTGQTVINKASVIEEFMGFLRSLSAHGRGQRHLLVNLQDRTSWQEHARCVAIEEIQKSAEFADSTAIVTLAKNTDFYWQSSHYLHVNEADAFIQQFKEQIASEEQCGFHFPQGINKEELMAFADKTMPLIHREFFGSKPTLLRKNRLDFIEIFYNLFVLKIIELYKPDTLSFTCKDGVDTSAAASAELYAFLRLMNDGPAWKKEEKDFLLWMIYSAALTVRERAIDIQRFNRLVSSMETVGAELEAHHDKVVSTFSKLFKLSFFKEVKVKETET